jgi:hypothetical protein
VIGRIYVAKDSFACTFEGEQLSVAKGDTAREGHPLLEKFPHLFAPQKVKFEHLPPPKKAPARK